MEIAWHPPPIALPTTDKPAIHTDQYQTKCPPHSHHTYAEYIEHTRLDRRWKGAYWLLTRAENPAREKFCYNNPF